MRIRYAWRNLLLSPGRFFISLFGISFAAFLMAMQGSLLYGFTLASSRIVDAVDSDIWIVGPGAASLEYGASIEERLAWLAPGVAGVAAAGRGTSGWAEIQKSNGDRFAVFAVGVDRDFRGRIPDVHSELAPPSTFDTVAAVDASDFPAVGITKLPVTVEINGQRADLVTATHGFASFLGTPFLFADLPDVRRFILRGPSSLNFILVRVKDGYNIAAVRDALRERFRNVDVWTTAEFSRRCRIYWLVHTGAGGALVISTILGFLIGVSLVAQTIYSQTAENVEEYATMKAMGAPSRYIISIVLFQSLICGAIGASVGLSTVGPFAILARRIVTWVVVPDWMYALVAAAVAMLCIIAAVIGSRPAMAVEPARVFRA
jgi:putative ABC transport system permease protein